MAGPDHRLTPEPAGPGAAPHVSRWATPELWADAAWVAILLAAGSFQIGRGAPVEGVPFVAGALALAADRLGWLRRFDTAIARPEAPRWAVWAVVIAAAIVIGATPEFGWPAGVLVAAAGLSAVLPTWQRRESGFAFGESAESGIRHAAIWWAGVAVALCLWELAAFFAGLPSAHADWQHPALSDLLRPAIGVAPLRALLFAAWLAAGWALVRRGWRPAPADGGGP
jgi:hypothetical protein